MSERGPPADLSRRRYLQCSAAAGTVAAVGAGSSRVGSVGVARAENGPAYDRWDAAIESHDGTEIVATVFRPAGASSEDPVPMVLHSHGWSGSRTASLDDGAGIDPTGAIVPAALERGFGVLSFDQRGHGDSGGQAHVMNPDLEGRDVIAVLDYVTELGWVERTPDEEGAPIADDPMVFTVGGSYGGAYQLVGAFTETARTGSTRFDALAPEITWFDLSESLAPEGVVRSIWALGLYALGAPNLADHVHAGFLWGATTGQWPDGSVDAIANLDEEFHRNGPSGFVEDDVRLDVPVLFGQGITDNLFTLNQGWHNLERGLTESARKRSALVGYNGGHALPNVLPPGEPFDVALGTSEGVCAEGGFGDLSLRFFESVREGEGNARKLVGSTYALTTADGERCVAVDALDDRTTVGADDCEVDVGGAPGADAGFPAVADLLTDDASLADLEVEARADLLAVVDDNAAPLERGVAEAGAATRLEALLRTVNGSRIGRVLDGVGDLLGIESQGLLGTGLLGDAPAVGDGLSVVTPTGAGVPTHLELAEGPLTVAGVPTLSATVTTHGVEQRLFAGLSVGRSRLDARVVANNLLPIREPEPVDGVRREVELPGVAVDVAADESLYLTLSAVSDLSLIHGSIRTPGVMELADVGVDVPFVEEPASGTDRSSGGSSNSTDAVDGDSSAATGWLGSTGASTDSSDGTAGW